MHRAHRHLGSGYEVWRLPRHLDHSAGYGEAFRQHATFFNLYPSVIITMIKPRNNGCPFFFRYYHSSLIRHPHVWQCYRYNIVSWKYQSVGNQLLTRWTLHENQRSCYRSICDLWFRRMKDSLQNNSFDLIIIESMNLYFIVSNLRNYIIKLKK